MLIVINEPTYCHEYTYCQLIRAENNLDRKKNETQMPVIERCTPSFKISYTAGKIMFFI